jgi:hypothetical protein
VQRQLAPNLALDVAYVGNKTTRLSQFVQRNDPLPGAGAIQNRRPYPQWGAVRSVEYGGFGTYNSFQAKLESREWHGSSFLISYTYSKCLDNGSSESTSTAVLIPINKGVCDFSIPQNFVASYSYALPVGQGKAFLNNMPKWANGVLGNWNISGIVTLQKGLPFTPTISGDQANTGVGSQRPNLTGTPTVVGNVSCWFYVAANPACQALASGTTSVFSVPAQYTYGTSGRNILRADGIQQLDFTVAKQFRFTESKALQIRVEFFNITNTPTFASPTTTIDTASGGQIGSTLNASRTIELAMKLFF